MQFLFCIPFTDHATLDDLKGCDQSLTTTGAKSSPVVGFLVAQFCSCPSVWELSVSNLRGKSDIRNQKDVRYMWWSKD